MKQENGQKETDKIEVCLKNLGTINKNVVIINKGLRYVKLYFSYETIVAVDSWEGFFVSVNKWSMTTGKMLNELEPNNKVLEVASRVLNTSLVA